MKNTQKAFAVQLVIAIIVVLAIAGGIYYSKNKKTEVPVVSTEEYSTDPVPEYIPPATWKTYTNTKYSYSFKYPPHYALHPDPYGTLGDLLGDMFDVTTPFHQSIPSSAVPNFTGAMFIAGGLPDSPCGQVTSVPVTKKTLGNNTYSTHVVELDGDTEEGTKVIYYWVTHNGQCSSFSLHIGVPGKNAPIPGMLDSVETESKAVEQILSTLKFTK